MVDPENCQFSAEYGRFILRLFLWAIVDSGHFGNRIWTTSSKGCCANLYGTGGTCDVDLRNFYAIKDR